MLVAEVVLSNDFDAITDDGKILKRISKLGFEASGEKIDTECTVVYNYRITVADGGQMFDSSYLRGRPDTVRLQEGSLLLGIDLAIRSMNKGETAEFLIEPEYGFGPRGIPPRVPGGAVLHVHLEIVDFFQKRNSEGLLVLEDKKSFEVVYKAAARDHRKGNKMVKEGDMAAALRAFNRGVRLLFTVSLKDETEQRQQEPLLLSLLLNLAESSLVLKRPNKACIACREALGLDPNNFKALFRFGRAKKMLEDLETARELFTKALRLRPSCDKVKEELEAIASELEQEDLEERAFRHTRLATPAWSISTDSYEDDLSVSSDDEDGSDGEDYYGESEGSSSVAR